ncbi:hypothetical protein [Photobacterium sp. GB-56]|uniref:hypothetical protein n=1 Tax=Photobacterium sp. GB-56 TaxID=2022106 RepID=UPI000D1816F0|nr:hypothetical protein [Photobacterium sp. GB-56]PSV24141.1 hypothetical protein C9J42_19445 [Photobacterium sp. GB-56]
MLTLEQAKEVLLPIFTKKYDMDFEVEYFNYDREYRFVNNSYIFHIPYGVTSSGDTAAIKEKIITALNSSDIVPKSSTYIYSAEKREFIRK